MTKVGFVCSCTEPPHADSGQTVKMLEYKGMTLALHFIEQPKEVIPEPPKCTLCHQSLEAEEENEQLMHLSCEMKTMCLVCFSKEAQGEELLRCTECQLLYH